MQATVKIGLSEAGQKDALTRGLSATCEQTLTVPVVAEDLQFFNVEKDGNLSLDLYNCASTTRNSWGSGWDHFTWDTYPTPTEILNYLHCRDEQRATVLAAEQAAKEKKVQVEQQQLAEAYKKFCSLPEEDQEELLNPHDQQVKINSVILNVDAYPEVVAAYARQTAKKAKAEAEAALKAAIPLAPKIGREIKLLPDGSCQFTVPGGAYKTEWAKRIVRVNPVQKGGFALEGNWLKCNEKVIAKPGEIIAVGSKEWQGSKKQGCYVQDFALYVVTPTRLVKMNSCTGVSVSAAFTLFTQDADERVEKALKKVVGDAEKLLAKLAALDPKEYASKTSLIAARTTAWLTLKVEAERVLTGIDPESKLTDIDSAAAAIVSAGYRELAKRYHPDTPNGSAQVMTLLSNAKWQLVEILAAAKEVK